MGSTWLTVNCFMHHKICLCQIYPHCNALCLQISVTAEIVSPQHVCAQVKVWVSSLDFCLPYIVH
jgi:hypothetical protein